MLSIVRVKLKRITDLTKPIEKKTVKSVKEKVKKDHLHLSHYLDTLHTSKSYVCKQNLLSSTNHTVHTVHQRKVGLTSFDTKRWLCEDTIHTHSHGHKDTVEDPMHLVNTSYIILCVQEPIKCLSGSADVWSSPRAELGA